MALKPLPKLIIIVGVVGGLGYTALNMNLGAMLPKKSAAPVVETSVAPTVVPPQPQPQPQPQAQVLEPASETPAPRPTTADMGLNAVLGAGKK